MHRPAVTNAEQLLGLDEPGYRHELLRGELRRMSAASYWHGVVAAEITQRLAAFVRAQHLGRVLAAETGFLLERDPDTVMAPDVAFVCAARQPAPLASGFYPGPPDLAVEVMSPGDTAAEVRGKAQRWLEHGTRVVWVVDPKRKRVTVYCPDQQPRKLGANDELIGGDVLPGFHVRVVEFFPAP